MKGRKKEKERKTEKRKRGTEREEMTVTARYHCPPAPTGPPTNAASTQASPTVWAVSL